MTPIEIGNLIFALQRGELNLRGLRVYLGCIALVAVREAARRSRKVSKRKGMEAVRFQTRELCNLTLLSERTVRKELRSLEAAKLLAFTGQAITFSREALLGSGEVVDTLSGGRSRMRPIPVPRTLLRHLARSKRKSLIVTSLVYAARGLSLGRSGAVKGAGTVKASWIAAITSLSLRAVKSARRELISSGFISKDSGSFQRKLNRDGAYFKINFAWHPSPRSFRVSKSQVSVRRDASNFAPPSLKKRATFAPPYKDKKTSSYEESKNQKTQSFALSRSGVLQQRGEGEDRPLPAPIIKNIQQSDLRSISRMEALYRQAVNARWIPASEADHLNWFGAGVRSITAADVRDPVRVFVSIVKRRDWHLITQEQEHRARRAIHRVQNW